MVNNLNRCMFWLKMMILIDWKYNTVWDKVSADIKKQFDSEPVYKKNLLKIKVKSHGDQVTDFYGKKIPKLDSNHTCLAVSSFDPTLKKDNYYYPQVFLKECKYNEKKVIRLIIDDLESSYDDSDDPDDSDEEFIKDMKSMFSEKTILKVEFSKMCFLSEQF